MSDSLSSIDLDKAKQIIENISGRINVFTHVKPDGDAFGSVVALVAALNELGADARGCLVPPVPTGIKRMDCIETVEINNDLSDFDKAELFIVVDTSAYSQLGPAALIIKNNLEKTLIIDHHLNGDIKTDFKYIEPQRAACCQIVAQLIEKLLVKNSVENDEDKNNNQEYGRGLQSAKGKRGQIMREALFLGIATDTGWFKFSNTTSSTHLLAGKLLEQGVNQARIYQKIEQMERKQKLSLLTRALDSLQYFSNNRAAMMELNREAFDTTGAYDQETERIIDLPQQVESLQVVALLSERLNEDSAKTNKYYTRISFRSKPGKGAIDVSKLANKFGGGGHIRAAGARVDEPIDTVARRVATCLDNLFN